MCADVVSNVLAAWHYQWLRRPFHFCTRASWNMIFLASSLDWGVAISLLAFWAWSLGRFWAKVLPWVVGGLRTLSSIMSCLSHYWSNGCLSDDFAYGHSVRVGRATISSAYAILALVCVINIWIHSSVHSISGPLRAMNFKPRNPRMFWYHFWCLWIFLDLQAKIYVVLGLFYCFLGVDSILLVYQTN